MSVKYAPSKLKVPPGFQNLLEGLSREVLRMQPDGHQAILEFAAEYFRGQQIRRDATGRDDAEKGKFMEELASGKTVNKVPPQHATPPSDIRLDASTGLLLADKSAAPAPVEEEIDIDLTDPEVAKAAGKIQAVFRKKGSPTKKTASPQPAATPPPEAAVPEAKPEAEVEETEEAQSLTEDEAAVKIQALVRGKQSRDEVQAIKASLTEVADDSEAVPAEPVDGTTAEATEEEMENAAIKIQSQIRGKLAKNEVARMKEAASETDVSAPADEPEPEEHAIDEAEAATKIQAVVRGHQARESVKSMTTTEGEEEGAAEDQDDVGPDVNE